jgi:hypothetical protein
MSIDEHDFTDSDVISAVSWMDIEVSLNFNDLCGSVDLSRDDVIALAKHFKLTAEDINQGDNNELR